ncbi:MAG: prepilin-type N-terminal cleavage/methylation domain-containing protein [bacterium]
MRPDLDTAKFRIPRGIPRGRKGSTLIEVMAALAIFSIVLTAAFATFIFQKQSYTTQTRVSEMQQNLRVSVDALFRDIRMGGYGVDSDVNVPLSAVGGAGTATIALRGFQGADGGSSAPDGIYILYSYDMDNTVSAMQPTLATASVTAVNSGTVTVSVTPGTGTRFASGDLVLLNNGSTADLYQVTASDNNSVTFGSSPAINANGHTSNVYDAGSKVSHARFVRYFVDGTDPAHPTLMVNRLPGTVSQPVADDIEDLQFKFGIASSVAGTQVDNTVDSLVSDLQRQCIRRVNLSIIARTRIFETGWVGQMPNLGNRTTVASGDHYRRRILDNVAIDIRNIRLN